MRSVPFSPRYSFVPIALIPSEKVDINKLRCSCIYLHLSFMPLTIYLFESTPHFYTHSPTQKLPYLCYAIPFPSIPGHHLLFCLVQPSLRNDYSLIPHHSLLRNPSKNDRSGPYTNQSATQASTPYYPDTSPHSHSYTPISISPNSCTEKKEEAKNITQCNALRTLHFPLSLPLQHLEDNASLLTPKVSRHIFQLRDAPIPCVKGGVQRPYYHVDSEDYDVDIQRVRNSMRMLFFRILASRKLVASCIRTMCHVWQ